jgi:transcriptional regulator with XRE-family HTH domain
VEQQPDTIGRRIAEHRKLRGWNQRQLAERVGYSMSLVEKIERGVRGVERYSTLHTFARALKIDVTELTGEPSRTRKQREHATIPNIRRVLTSLPFGVEDGPFRRVEELQRDVSAAIARRELGRYTRFGEDLPVLLGELSRAASTSPDETAALQALIAETLHSGSILLRRLGYVDLSWIALQQARPAAAQSDDPLLTIANDWHLTELYMRNGDAARAVHVAERAIQKLEESHLSNQPAPRVLSLLGTLHLIRSMAAAQNGERRDVDAAIATASRAAKRNGRDRDDYQSQFGPANVAIFGVSTAVEMGDGDLAIRRSKRVDTDAIPSRERQARYLIDVARAYSQARKDAAALQIISEAHRRAPEYVANHVMAREVVAELLERERRAVTPGLRTLAKKMGIA